MELKRDQGKKIMNFMGRLDQEFETPLKAFPRIKILNPGDIKAARKMTDLMLRDVASKSPPVKGVESRDQLIPGPPGDPDILVRVYSPEKREEILPAMLWMHGGGYVLGNVDFDDIPMKHIARDVGCVVVSVDYRLAPENPFPAPLEDCYAALRWLMSKSGELGIEKSRVAVGGASAGGGLAAGLALLARDRDELDVAFQLLIYPMLDDRNITPSSRAITDPRVWNRESNISCWRAYLGQDETGDDVPVYAAPSRATDLSGLAPAYIAVGELDMFLDEDVEYAQRLIQACVSTELHVYPGAIHGFDGLAPAAGVSMRFTAERDGALRKALCRKD